MTDKEQTIIDLLQQVNKSLAKAIALMEFLIGEKIKKDLNNHP
jgi:hypothetical protein